MNELLTATGIMLGLSCALGGALALAQRYLAVEEDVRVEQVESMLPGTNCGACGQPGCRGFAEALVAARVAPGKCSVSTPAGVEAIARFLGVDAGFEEQHVARLHCAGGKTASRRIAEYQGLASCRAAFVVNGGGKACPWGCLGLGDCERACTFAAIRMNDEELPVVALERCTACGDCVAACPLDLFTLEPISSRLLVQCSSPLAGELVRSLCHVACDACGRCAADAPAGAVEMVDGLPVVREPREVTEACTWRCPTGAIQWVEGEQFLPRRSALRIEAPRA